MKIVILDAKTIGSDINLDSIRAEGELIIYETTPADQTFDRIKNAEIIITNKVVIGKKEMDIADKLKLICVAATGYNNIDIQEANKKNIAVTNVKAYSTESVAQQLFAYILAFYNSIFEFQKIINDNKWQQSDVFSMLNFPIFELKNKKIGIIGYGAIGKRVAEIAKVFGMEILIAKIPGENYNDDFRTEFNELISNSDIITVHVPLNDKTKNLIAKEQLSIMKKTAIIANYARGGVVNENDLFFALKNKEIRGAIVDVLTNEPPEKGNILFNAPNVFITPHTAWTSVEARQKLIDGILRNIQIFKKGQIDSIKIIS